MKSSPNIKSDDFYETAWTYVRYIIDVAREPFLILDNDLRVISANDAFYGMFSVIQKDTEGVLVYDLGNKQWDIPQLRKLLEDILPNKTFFKDYEVEHEFPTIGKKVMMVNARMMFGKGNINRLLLWRLRM